MEGMNFDLLDEDLATVLAEGRLVATEVGPDLRAPAGAAGELEAERGGVEHRAVL
jgi:hypothetical protein